MLQYYINKLSSYRQTILRYTDKIIEITSSTGNPLLTGQHYLAKGKKENVIRLQFLHKLVATVTFWSGTQN